MDPLMVRRAIDRRRDCRNRMSMKSIQTGKLLWNGTTVFSHLFISNTESTSKNIGIEVIGEAGKAGGFLDEAEAGTQGCKAAIMAGPHLGSNLDLRDGK
jgi:hypothetical protein